ncbi:MAG: hypothetical protein AAFO91_14480 [Bacteroidota bacterium]
MGEIYSTMTEEFTTVAVPVELFTTTQPPLPEQTTAPDVTSEQPEPTTESETTTVFVPGTYRTGSSVYDQSKKQNQKLLGKQRKHDALKFYTLCLAMR